MVLLQYQSNVAQSDYNDQVKKCGHLRWSIDSSKVNIISWCSQNVFMLQKRHLTFDDVRARTGLFLTEVYNAIGSYIVNWRFNKLLLLHNLYSGAKHIPLFSQRPFHQIVLIVALFIVTRQTQYCDQKWKKRKEKRKKILRKCV